METQNDTVLFKQGYWQITTNGRILSIETKHKGQSILHINFRALANNESDYYTYSNHLGKLPKSVLLFLSEHINKDYWNTQLGFLPSNVKEQANKQLQASRQQDFDPNREGTQSFDDMLLYNYEQQQVTTSKEKADLKFDKDKIEAAKSRKKFQELLNDPDNKKLVEIKIQNKKQELSNKINSLDPSDPEYKSKLDD